MHPDLHVDILLKSLKGFIVSLIGTYNYKLSKYLCSLLQPHIPSERCSQDSFTFVQQIQDLSMHGKYILFRC